MESSNDASFSTVGFLLATVLLADSLWILGRARALGRAETESRSPTLLGQVVLFASAGAYLTYYVASEDSYRRSGISRWEAYDAHVMTVVAIAACLSVSALALFADRRRGRSVWLAAPAGMAAGLLFAAAFVLNTNN